MSKRRLDDLDVSSTMTHKAWAARIEAGIDNQTLFKLFLDSCLHQINQSKLERLNPMQSLRSDPIIRKSIYTYLTASQQRTLFLRLGALGHATRFRALFGAPPYAFLLPGDAEMLDTTMLAPKRTRFAYEDSNRIPTHCQFGQAHCYDVDGREYRLHDPGFPESTTNMAAKTLVRLSSPREGIESIERAFDHDTARGVWLLCRRQLNKATNVHQLPFPNERIVLSNHRPTTTTASPKAPTKVSAQKPARPTDATATLSLVVYKVLFDSPTARTALVQVIR